MESIRVDATLLDSFQRKTVRIIGKFESIQSNDETSILFNSNGNIILKFSNTYDVNYQLMTSYGPGNFFEIIGLVDEDLTVKVIQCIYFGDNINVNGVNKLVSLCHKVPELFYSSTGASAGY